MTRTQSGTFVRPRRSVEAAAFSGLVRTVLEDLIGRTVDLRLLLPRGADQLREAADDGTVVARYTTADASADRYLLVDLPAMAYLGGARAMLSHGVVAAALDSEQWPDSLLDNCFDVLSRFSLVWSFPDRTARLESVHGPIEGAPPTPELAAVLAGPARTLDAEVTVRGYGTGRLAVLRA